MVLEAFGPTSMTLAVCSDADCRSVAGQPGLFEMTWNNDGRATFSYGPEREADHLSIARPLRLPRIDGQG